MIEAEDWAGLRKFDQVPSTRILCIMYPFSGGGGEREGGERGSRGRAPQRLAYLLRVHDLGDES